MGYPRQIMRDIQTDIGGALIGGDRSESNSHTQVPDLVDSDDDDDDFYYMSTATSPVSTAAPTATPVSTAASTATPASTALSTATPVSTDVSTATPATIETVEGNERLYSKREVETAIRVKKFSAVMGHLSQGILHEIDTGRVQGLDFTHDDIERANSIYGPDPQAVRGKPVKYKHRRV
jgi:hypothetical protein